MKKLAGFLRQLLIPGARQVSTPERKRNACCSFCRISYRDCGPLVEGPGEVFICSSCIDLCRSILDQERLRQQQIAEN